MSIKDKSFVGFVKETEYVKNPENISDGILDVSFPKDLDKKKYEKLATMEVICEHCGKPNIVNIYLDENN